jgi:hypothetical protein
MANLKKELADLPAPLNSRLTRTKSIYAWPRVFLDSDYKSDMTYRALKQYYEPLLEEKGWRLAEENILRDYGRDFGIREFLFCKSPYAANLEYAGEKTEHPGGFALSLSWRLHSICNSPFVGSTDSLSKHFSPRRFSFDRPAVSAQTLQRQVHMEVTPCAKRAG